MDSSIDLVDTSGLLDLANIRFQLMLVTTLCFMRFFPSRIFSSEMCTYTKQTTGRHNHLPFDRASTISSKQVHLYTRGDQNPREQP
jgi:hypothetical protein